MSSWPPPPYRTNPAERYDALLDAVLDQHEGNDWPVSRSVLARVLREEKKLESHEARELVRHYCTRRCVLPTERQAAERAVSRVIFVCTAFCLAVLVSGPIKVEMLLRRHSPDSVIADAVHVETEIIVRLGVIYVLVTVVCLVWLTVRLRHLRHDAR